MNARTTKRIARPPPTSAYNSVLFAFTLTLGFGTVVDEAGLGLVVEGLGEGELPPGVGVGEGVGLGVGDGLGEGDGDGLGDGVGAGVGLGVGEGVGEGDGLTGVVIVKVPPVVTPFQTSALSVERYILEVDLNAIAVVPLPPRTLKFTTATIRLPVYVPPAATNRAILTVPLPPVEEASEKALVVPSIFKNCNLV
jgi:hypothetical protein